jgi:phage terminase large subunit-like protein
MTAYPQSPLVEVMTELGRLGCAEAALATLTERELMSLTAAWWEAWARPDQVLPPDDQWDIHAFIGGRGSGKTAPNARYVHEQAINGRATRILCIGAEQDKAVEIFATGPSGLLNIAPPWERPYLKGSTVIWPNGATATIITAGALTDPRGLNVELSWCTEIRDWKRSQAVETWRNVDLCTRVGIAKIVCDTTPHAGDPVIAEIEELAENDSRVRIVEAPIEANRPNLARGYVERQRRRLAGTRAEQEELDGKKAAECGLVKRADIEGVRREMPTVWKRRIVIVDPARSDPRHPNTHNTGLVTMGLGVDDQLFVTRDQTDKMFPETWATKAINEYLASKCDCMVIETNSGGTLNTSVVKLMAQQRGLSVNVVDLKAKVRHSSGVINIKEVYARTDKSTRFEIAEKRYVDHKISHVRSADLDALETTLTSWHPSEGTLSPGDLDCVAWGTIELLGMHEQHQQRGAAAGQRKAVEAARSARRPDRTPVTQLRPQQARQQARRRRRDDASLI